MSRWVDGSYLPLALVNTNDNVSLSPLCTHPSPLRKSHSSFVPPPSSTHLPLIQLLHIAPVYERRHELIHRDVTVVVGIHLTQTNGSDFRV